MSRKSVVLLLLLGGTFQVLTGAATAFVAVKVERLSSMSLPLPPGMDDDDATPVVQRVGCNTVAKVSAFKKR